MHVCCWPLHFVHRSPSLKGSDCEGFSAERDGSAVVAARPYGSSSRSQTARITVRLPDGSLTDYFLRVSATGLTIPEFPNLVLSYSPSPW